MHRQLLKNLRSIRRTRTGRVEIILAERNQFIFKVLLSITLFQVRCSLIALGHTQAATTADKFIWLATLVVLITTYFIPGS